jgi:hypothetical protein
MSVLATAILSLLPLAPLASAQGYDRDDPPTRAGRLGFVEGSVSFQPGGEGDWLQAVPNRPLTVGDNLWVDRDSRAEVQIGSTSIRLGPETSLSFLDLGNDVTQLRLSTGSLFVRVRHFRAGEDVLEVDTPNIAFNVDRAGEFRLNANANGDETVATLWHGDGVITGGGNSYRLMEGQTGSFSGVDQISYNVDQVGSQDPFDRWSVSRDEREDRASRNHYVSDEMTGYEDLEENGRWHSVEGYGNVWTPTRVRGDWAPYRDGHWGYVAPWGWTWVDDEPWGFAPFHYGRWAHLENSWCWVPGPVAVAPVYSPALVAFVGGGGFSVGIGVGGGRGVGWFPLAPGEVYVPWYHTSERYVQQVNVSNTRVNVTQVTNVYNNVNSNNVTNVTYVNQRVTNSVTVVNHDTFVNARPVQNNIVRVDARQIASAPVTHEAVRNIQPAAESVRGPARPAQARPPEQAINRAVVATRQPEVVNRPPQVPGMARPAAPPPVRTMQAAPPAQAQQLQRGQRGNSNGAAPGAVGAGNRPGAAPQGNQGQGNQGQGNQGRLGTPENAARPGAPQPANPQPGNRPAADQNYQGLRPGAPETGPRPGQPENRNVPQPGNPQPGNRPAAEQNQGPRPGTPETAPRPGQPENRNVPQPGNNRPGEAARPAEAPRPNAPGNNANVPRPNAPENNRPGAQPNQVPRPNAPETAPRPGQPENRPGAENNRNVPQPGNNRPGEVARPNETPSFGTATSGSSGKPTAGYPSVGAAAGCTAKQSPIRSSTAAVGE